MRIFLKIILLSLLLSFGKFVYSAIVSPILISVSIVPDAVPALVEIKWIPSSDESVVGYNIYYKQQDGIWGKIHTVWGRTTNSYQFIHNETNYNISDYKISAFDNSLLNSPMTTEHTTMLLNSLSFAKCDTAVNLSWSAYGGWTGGVDKYRIYRRTDISSYELIDSVVNSLTYTDNMAEMFYTYYYYIEAVSTEGYTATSNSANIFSEGFIPPNYIIANYATVDSTKVKLLFTVDSNAKEVSKYYIKRKDYNTNGEYLQIVEIENIGQSQIFYNDMRVKTSDYSYSYVISAVSFCGIESAISNAATTILLKAQSIDDVSGKLEWTEYYYWEKLVLEYNIYLEFNDSSYLIGTNDYNNLNFYHDIKNFVVNNHKNKIKMSNRVCYSVEAIENYIDATNITYKSRSNIACMNKEPIIFVPNAFNPSSEVLKNREFRPVVSFIDLEGYEFKIFDRFGNRVFETTDVYEGWNGKTKNGNLSEQQVYSYLIKYKDLNGKTKRKTGTVTVVIK